jgi:hypothetical protein
VSESSAQLMFSRTNRSTDCRKRTRGKLAASQTQPADKVDRKFESRSEPSSAEIVMNEKIKRNRECFLN